MPRNGSIVIHLVERVIRKENSYLILSFLRRWTKRKHVQPDSFVHLNSLIIAVAGNPKQEESHRMILIGCKPQKENSNNTSTPKANNIL